MLDQLLNNYTLQIVLLGTLLLGIVSGVIGVFLTLRKQALVSDAVSHATLPGIVLAYIISSQSSTIVSLIGGAIAALISIFVFELIKKYTKIKNDAVLAIILSSFYGLGQVLLSVIRDTAGSNQARLTKFIFGQAATMSLEDVYILVGVLVAISLIIVIFYRHLKLFIFNSDFYRSLGFKGYLVSFVLNLITILVVVSGIQAVGVILMSALLVAPAITARLWSNKLITNLVIAGLIGALSGALGTIIGVSVPTGPVIVIVASLIVIASLLFVPKKGVVWKKIAKLRYKKDINKYHGLIHISASNSISNLKEEEIALFLAKELIILNNETYELTKKGQSVVNSILFGR